MTVSGHVEEVNGAQVDERVYMATQLPFVFFPQRTDLQEMGYVHSHLFMGSIHKSWET